MKSGDEIFIQKHYKTKKINNIIFIHIWIFFRRIGIIQISRCNTTTGTQHEKRDFTGNSTNRFELI